MPRRLAVLMMRTAISPRLAIRIFSNMMTDRLPLGFLPRVAIGAQAGGDAQPSIRGSRAGNQAPPLPDVSGVVLRGSAHCSPRAARRGRGDRKSVVSGKRVSGRVDP